MQGDPVSLAREVNSRAQRVFNRTKKEAHTIEADHCVAGNDVARIVELVPPGAHYHVRITEVYAQYTGAGAGLLSITDGVANFQLMIGADVVRVRLDTTRWEEGSNVTVTLAAGGAQGYLNVVGAFAEKLANPDVLA